MPISANAHTDLSLNLPTPVEINGRGNFDAKIGLDHPDDHIYKPCAEAELLIESTQGSFHSFQHWQESVFYPGTTRKVAAYVPNVTPETELDVIIFNDGAAYASLQGSVRATQVQDTTLRLLSVPRNTTSFHHAMATLCRTLSSRSLPTASTSGSPATQPVAPCAAFPVAAFVHSALHGFTRSRSSASSATAARLPTFAAVTTIRIWCKPLIESLCVCICKAVKMTLKRYSGIGQPPTWQWLRRWNTQATTRVSSLAKADIRCVTQVRILPRPCAGSGEISQLWLDKPECVALGVLGRSTRVLTGCRKLRTDLLLDPTKKTYWRRRPNGAHLLR